MNLCGRGDSPLTPKEPLVRDDVFGWPSFPGKWYLVDYTLPTVRIPRERVYLAIDSERSYQDHLKEDRTSNPTDGTRSIDHTVGDFSIMMQQYMNELAEAWTKNPGDMPALHVMRKIAGIAVNCMEQHGAPLRKPVPGFDFTWRDPRADHGLEVVRPASPDQYYRKPLRDVPGSWSK